MKPTDPSSAQLGIDALGYEPDQKQMYLDALSNPYGMILVTGPTGSGKTVSLYTGLNILNTEERNISTAEDPAEINLEGINQVNVNDKVGLTFAEALKAWKEVRAADPDDASVDDDDASTDETLARLEAAKGDFPALRVLRMKENAGQSAAHRRIREIRGIRVARRQCGRLRIFHDLPPG